MPARLLVWAGMISLCVVLLGKQTGILELKVKPFQLSKVVPAEEFLLFLHVQHELGTYCFEDDRLLVDLEVVLASTLREVTLGDRAQVHVALKHYVCAQEPAEIIGGVLLRETFLVYDRLDLGIEPCGFLDDFRLILPHFVSELLKLLERLVELGLGRRLVSAEDEHGGQEHNKGEKTHHRNHLSGDLNEQGAKMARFNSE